MSCAIAMSRCGSARPSPSIDLGEGGRAVTKLVRWPQGDDARCCSSPPAASATPTASISRRSASPPTIAAASSSSRRRCRPRCRTSMPPATSSAFRASPRRRWSRAGVAACHAFGLAPPPPPEFFPYGIYSVPEISTVGMTEEEVSKREIPYECGIARFRETSRGHIMGLNSGHDEDDLLDPHAPPARASTSSARARPN